MLRTQHVAYLRDAARWGNLDISKAFGAAIDAATGAACKAGSTGKPLRVHVSIKSGHLAILDRMAIETGLSRSEVARRLIDEAARAG